MTEYSTDVRRIRGIGEKRAEALNRLGIHTLLDLVSWFPMRYEDRSVVTPIGETADGESACICAIAATAPVLQRIPGRMEIVKVQAVDETGRVDISFFHQPFVKNQIRKGETYRFYGKISQRGGRRMMANPVFEAADEARGETTGRIVPVYRLTAGLTQKTMMQSIRQGLDMLTLPDALPAHIRGELPDAETAYEEIHFPVSMEQLRAARKRFAFEELFLLCCAMGQRKAEAGEGIVFPRADFAPFYAALPYTPTGAQQRAISEAAADLVSGRRMNRLLQGDVGSGKTLVAAALIWQCARGGMVSAFMAPTEILARQHLHTMREFLTPFGLRCELLTGSTPAEERRRIHEALERREIDLLVGTHALLGIEIPGLALAVTDEQHRFGVTQRAVFTKGGEAIPPHVLVMSATPIPRTLSLVIYGDLEVSRLDEMPPGRQKVDTFCVNSAYHRRLLAFIRKLCGEGRQVFVVCPKVEDDADSAEEDGEGAGLLSAVEYARRLSGELPELRIACIHGRMKAKEKNEVMEQMAAGSIQVLVATTVIEVGMDVPNAALILIENAERYGLSQLHQLRGRVGRGKHKSYCVLVTDHKSEETRARMEIMCKSGDGFAIAEEDLRLRGPGDFFGQRQHGLPALHVADLGTDTQTLLEAKAAADELLREDPLLQTAPLVRERVNLLLEKAGGTLN